MDRLKVTIDDSTEDFPELLRENGIFITQAGTCFCPFHGDANHRSAKVFKDPDGWRMFCFAENRQFRPSDFYRLVLGADVVAVGSKEKVVIPTIDFSPIVGFRTGEVTIQQVCKFLFEQKEKPDAGLQVDVSPP